MLDTRTISAVRVSLMIAMHIGIMVGCERESANPEKAAAPISVEVIKAPAVSVPRHVRVTGTLYGQEETTVAAKVEGRVVEILQDVGDDVTPGELLVRIDPTDFMLARDEKMTALSQALAELGLEELPTGSFDVADLPTVERSRLQAENARLRFERAKQLREQDPPLISDQDYTDLQTTWEVAQADHRVAVLTAEALLAQAHTFAAQLRTAEQRVTDASHLVPSGLVPSAGSWPGDSMSLKYVVTARMVSVGDLVRIGTPLFRLVDPDPVKLRAAVPERRAATMRQGLAARVWTDAQPEPVDGRITRINPAVSPLTRTFDIEIMAPNPNRQLNPGAFARAEVSTGAESGVVVVPADAILNFAGVSKVMVVKDDRAEDRPVVVGEQIGDGVEIISGIEPGTRIARRPSAALTGGSRLQITVIDWFPRIDGMDIRAEASE